jgi:O-succinylbenzoate synthase
LPGWSRETLEEAILQLEEKKEEIIHKQWSKENILNELVSLRLFPSVSFALESALISLIDPLEEHAVSVGALFMGSSIEILEQADQREQEGYTTAKVKIGSLSWKEAEDVIGKLLQRFRLRIDVNRGWKALDALAFFNQFSLDAVEYVEEPFDDPLLLREFTHPLAIDESFPKILSLEELEKIPMLRSIIYKPTIQGGMANCFPLVNWAQSRGIDVVIGGSFESELGLMQAASLAYRLSLKKAVGIGTYCFLQNKNQLLSISEGILYIPGKLLKPR